MRCSRRRRRCRTGTPPHRHAQEDEAFYVLEGQYTFLHGEQAIECGPGDVVFVPRGDVHAYTNSGATPARMLIINTPGRLHEGFFLALGEPVDTILGRPTSRGSSRSPRSTGSRSCRHGKTKQAGGTIESLDCVAKSLIVMRQSIEEFLRYAYTINP